MKLLIGLAGALLALAPLCARADVVASIVDQSKVVGTTPVALVTAPSTVANNFIRTTIRFELASAGPTLWCRYDGGTPSVGGLGSFSYTGVGSGENFAPPGIVPQIAFLCVSDTAGTNVNVWVGPQ